MDSDAVRFLYERRKLRDHDQLKLEDFQPYPGMFLGDDLEERIIRTIELLKQDFFANQDEQAVSECEKIIILARNDQQVELDTKAWLKSFSEVSLKTHDSYS